MKNFFKQYKKIFIIVIIPYLVALFCLVYPTKYDVIAPGELRSVSKVYESEEFVINDNFYTVYIIHYFPLTPFQTLLTKNDPKMAVSVYDYKDSSQADEYKKGQLSNESSLIESAIVAYTEASKIDSTITIDYEFKGLKIYSAPKRIKELAIGTEIYEINGDSYLNYLDNPNAFLDLLKLDENNQITFTLSDSTEIIYTKEENESISFLTNFQINSTTPKLDIPGINDAVGGPSGGLIQAISLYASLLKLNTANIKIAGTGTVDYAGNVGKIGGIRQKIYTANRTNIDYFFVPLSQYELVSNITTKYQIVPVESFREAVDFLNEAIK